MSARLNIVIPMAGRGQRFWDAGYKDPKPLIPVHGHPMIELVIENLRPSRPHRFIFLCQAEHLKGYGLVKVLESMAPDSVIVPVKEITEGAACTVLLARNFIDDDSPLMIANCDQWITADIDTYLACLDESDADGLIMTMEDSDPKWSFVGFDSDGNVEKVVEKQPISRSATVGIYNLRRGNEFVSGADAMIAAELRTNGEFYVAPVFNELLRQHAKIITYSVGPLNQGMFGLGTPPDLVQFLDSPVSRSAIDKFDPART